MKGYDVECTHHAISSKARIVHRPHWRGDPDRKTIIEILIFPGEDETWFVHKVADVEALIELLQDAVNVAKGLQTQRDKVGRDGTG